MSGVPVIGMESPRGVNDPSLGKLAAILAKADVVLLVGKPLDFTLKFGQVFSKGCRILRAGGLVDLPEPTASQRDWFEEVRAALAYRPAEWRFIDGKLHPVVNQTSALLIVGSAGSKPVKVSRPRAPRS